MSSAALYETDIVLWSEEQARALREAAGSLSNQTIDWQNIAEEIADLGKRERDRLASQIETIIEHLAKLQASPASDPRIGWQLTVVRCRARISNLLEDIPSLRQSVPAVAEKRHAAALKIVARELALRGETPRADVADLRYTADQILDDWWPAAE